MDWENLQPLTENKTHKNNTNSSSSIHHKRTVYTQGFHDIGTEYFDLLKKESLCSVLVNPVAAVIFLAFEQIGLIF